MDTVSTIGFKNGTITLNEPRAVYYPGQVISGKIQFEVASTLNFSVINVQFNGCADVRWTEKQTVEYNGVSQVTDQVYHGREEYFNHMQTLCGGNGTTQLNQGLHTFAFGYQIPFKAPSTFRGDRGNITYTVTAYVDYPDYMTERETLVKEFEIVGALDLNANPIIKNPLQMDFEEFYGSCCMFDCGGLVPMTMSIRLPVTGYCPGQNIVADIDVNNTTNIEVSNIVLQLVKGVKYHSQQPQSDYIPPDEVICFVKRGPVMRSTKRHYTCELLVPDMIAHNLEHCSIIDIGYFVKARVSLSGCNDDLTDEVEICIGLLPLEADKTFYKHPMQSSLPNGPLPDPNKVSSRTSLEIGFRASDVNASINPTNNLPYPISTPEKPPYPVSNNTNFPYPSSMPYPSPNLPYPIGTSPNHPHPPGTTTTYPYPAGTSPNVPYSAINNVPSLDPNQNRPFPPSYDDSVRNCPSAPPLSE